VDGAAEPPADGAPDQNPAGRPVLPGVQLLELRFREAMGRLRTKEIEFKGLGLDDPKVSDEKILAALESNPVLLERPIYEKGGKAVIGRPTEKIRELL